MLPVFAGICVFFYLDNGSAATRWLNEDENGKELLLSRIRDEKSSRQVSGHTALDAFRSVKVWLFACVYFFIVMGLYGVSF